MGFKAGPGRGGHGLGIADSHQHLKGLPTADERVRFGVEVRNLGIFLQRLAPGMDGKALRGGLQREAHVGAPGGDLAFAVLVEGGASGGSVAGPVARTFLDAVPVAEKPEAEAPAESSD